MVSAAKRASQLGMELVCASQGEIVEICRLLNAGADVNYVHVYRQGGQEFSTTPLLQAVAFGFADAARVLISRGAEVNWTKPENDFTPLHVAAEKGHIHVIELLMSKGARHDARNMRGQTPLHNAAAKGWKEASICLLDHGADVNAIDDQGFTPLLFTIQEGHFQLFDLLIQRGADVNCMTEKGTNPLRMAALLGRLNFVKLLVEKGAEVDHLDDHAWRACAKVGTPLMLAAQGGHFEVVKFLVERGAAVDQPDDFGSIALGAASFFGHFETVEFLLSAGADINHINALRIVSLICCCEGRTF